MEACSIYENHLNNLLQNIFLYKRGEIDVSQILNQDKYLDLERECDVKSLIDTYGLARRLMYHFPGIFISNKYKLRLTNSISTKLKLKLVSIPFEIKLNQIFINGYYYYQPLLVLRVLTFLSQDDMQNNSYVDSCLWNHIEDLPQSDCSKRLKEKLGEDYSYGMLVDFCDNLYDQYKYTGIGLESFRNVFMAFPHYIEEIGNSAFDMYIETRDWEESWRRSLINKVKLYLNIKTKDLSIFVDLLFR